MTQSAATILVWLLAMYVCLGLVFAVLFATRWAGRLDPAARRGTWGFRLLIVPGAALLWPVLVTRLVRAR